jgi:hypothetical protein
MTEMLWSDPQMLPGRTMSKRGVGCQFGPDVTERFLKDNNLSLLVRSHEVRVPAIDRLHSHTRDYLTLFSFILIHDILSIIYLMFSPIMSIQRLNNGRV